MLIRPRAEARIPVPDARFDWLCDLYKPVSRVPAFLTILDIAGLTAVRLRLHSFEIPTPCITF
jgi:ribosome-binding ATPase YchF (GTP1/OBG family)